ncbi:hypothetical protein EW146_g103 [Bondarzewia mesenterica]|uniref:RNA helicase n=1 Tax=Bondarzewia mesenterica TaxID=1095465 RepID=A0A4S4MEC4_9AGAM|nr:hypothetical protein EW146_g103 [Bondarzewia mesenterica]
MHRIPSSLCSSCRARFGLTTRLESRIFSRNYAAPVTSWSPNKSQAHRPTAKDHSPPQYSSRPAPYRRHPTPRPTSSSTRDEREPHPSHNVIAFLKALINTWHSADHVTKRLTRFGIPKKDVQSLTGAFRNDVLNDLVFYPEKFSKEELANISMEMSTIDRANVGDKILTSAFYAWAFDPARKDIVRPATADQMQRLRESADFTRIADMFPAARTLRRKIIMHVGPTNSGKTHNALRALAASTSGAYAGPLRLLAHEIYERLNSGQIVPLGVEPDADAEPAEDSNFDTDTKQSKTIRKVGDKRYVRACSLLTGEEQKQDPDASVYSCTIEMFNYEKRYDVVVVDEIQMIGEFDRGYAWTAVVMGACATELHLCGEETAVPVIEAIVAMTGDELIVNRYQRLSPLKVADKSLEFDLSKIQKGDCIVAFSRSNIFTLKEKVEKVTGLRCAVAYGRLPPELRSEQATLFNDPDSGYDVMIGSDAIGMGLNLKIKRVVFVSLEKFNGREVHSLSNSQIKQIGGRAGRYGLSDEGGLVTTMDPRDMERLREAMDAPMRPLPCARVGWFPGQFERVIEVLPLNASTETAEDVMKYLATLPPPLGMMRSDTNRTRLIRFVDTHTSDLMVLDRAMFGHMPFPIQDAVCTEAAEQMILLYREQGRVDLRRVLERTNMLDILNDVLVAMESGSKTEMSTTALQALESLHKVLVAYSWLHYHRHVAFFALDQATVLRQKTERAMDYCLQSRAAKKQVMQRGGDNIWRPSYMRQPPPRRYR